jgi:apolipoprotein N-acyltransferase
MGFSYKKRFMVNSNFLLYFAAILTGGIFPCAFAPYQIWPLAILSPAVLLWLWQYHSPSPSKAFLLGLSYGIGMFGIGFSPALFITIYRYGNTEIPLAILITTLTIIFFALFIAVQGYSLKKFFRGNTTTFALIGFPSNWVLFEWLRSWLFTGFPWLFLGYTQLDTFLKGYAPIVSVYGVSLAVALNSGALVTICKEKHLAKLIALFLIIIVWSGGYLLQLRHYTALDPALHTVSLIQGNIEPFDKFSQSDPIGATESIYGALTHNEWGAEVILWPESAILLPLPYSQSYIDTLQDRAHHHQATLITGIQIINEQGQYYNSLIAVGQGEGIYHKHHLLPFGDFLPLENWLRGLIGFFSLPMSSFTIGPKNQNLITAGQLKLAPLICYEIAFPELVRETLRDANVIITLSEDGWFGDSWGPHQHLQVAQMRALETGRFVLRATTSGITAIIEPSGKLQATAPQFTATALKGTFYSAKGQTPWSKIGLWPFIIFLGILFLLPGRVSSFFQSNHQ